MGVANQTSIEAYHMKKFLVATIASAAIAAPLAAQESVITGRESTFSITPYAGYMFFGDLGDVSANTDLTQDDAFMFGAQGKVRMTSRWAVYGNAAYSKTNFQVESEAGGTPVNVSGDIGYFLGDVGLEYRLPFRFAGGSVGPFVQGGIGAVRYSPDVDDLSDENATTNVAFNAGVGIDFNAGPVGLQLMLKDYVTSLDWNEVSETIDNQDDGDFDASKVANNLALTLGVRINF